MNQCPQYVVGSAVVDHEPNTLKARPDAVEWNSLEFEYNVSF